MWKGVKQAVVSPIELPTGVEMRVTTGQEGFGVVILDRPARMIAAEVDRKEYFEDHRVTRKEREGWWPDVEFLFVYPVSNFDAFDRIRKKAKLEPTNDADCPDCLQNIDGLCRLHDVECKDGYRCDEFTEIKDWRTGEIVQGQEPETKQGQEATMPYTIEEKGDEYCVIKEDTGEEVKCHPTMKEAQAHLAALKINVEEAEEKESEPEQPDIEALQARIAELEQKAAQFDESEWDGAAANWPDTAAYCKSCLIDVNPAGEDKVQALCKLPVYAPGSKKPNKAAVKAAGGGARGVSALKKPEGVSGEAWSQAVNEAKRRLRGWWPDAFDTEPPESLKAIKQEEEPAEEEAEGVCYCAKCDEEVPHMKGTDCADQACPKCEGPLKAVEEGEATEEPQEEEKAGRRLRSGWVKKLKEAVATLTEFLGFAEYDDLEGGELGWFKSQQAKFAIKQGPDGEPWVVAWSSNAFIDRDKEIFSTSGLERYVRDNEGRKKKGTFNFWHIPGTEYAEKRWQGVVGRFLLETGPFLDTAAGRQAKAFFTQYPDNHPTIAPEGWGTSVEFRYLPEEKKNRVFEHFWITRTSILPKLNAANIWTKGGIHMALTEEQEKALREVFPDSADQLIKQGQDQTKELEEGGGPQRGRTGKRRSGERISAGPGASL